MTRVRRSRIVKTSGLLAVVAECRDCPWKAARKNAAGIAFQHAERHGHHVSVEQTISVGYYPEGHPDLAAIRRRSR